MPIPWAQAREAWKALIEQARETRAATRNLRHLALLRRTLWRRETRRDPGDSRESRRPEAP